MSEMEILSGQIVHIRKLSKKMMFVDIFVINNNELTVEKQRKKLVFKFWDLPSTMWDRTNRGKDKLHVGDSVSFHGGWQDDLFSVSSYDFITKWNDKYNWKSFYTHSTSFEYYGN